MSFTKIDAASYLFMGMDASGSGNGCLPIGDNIDKEAIAPLTCSEGTSRYFCSCSKLRCPEIF